MMAVTWKSYFGLKFPRASVGGFDSSVGTFGSAKFFDDGDSDSTNGAALARSGFLLLGAEVGTNGTAVADNGGVIDLGRGTLDASQATQKRLPNSLVMVDFRLTF